MPWAGKAIHLGIGIFLVGNLISLFADDWAACFWGDFSGLGLLPLSGRNGRDDRDRRRN